MASRSVTRTKKRANAHHSHSESPTEDMTEEGYASGGDSDEDARSLHSDALDEDFDNSDSRKKRRRVAPPSKQKSTPSKGKSTPRLKPKSTAKQGTSEAKPARKKRKIANSADEGEDDDGSEVELKDGQEIVGKVVEAPKTGWAPEGQISRHTLDFLKNLQDPTCNDRVWFKLHEPVYRRCEKEFKAFIEAFTTMLSEVDPQIPPLPPKDVIHRIYRDIRFSNDKTPYKTGFSASFSRSGRKGTFAFYHVSVKPGNHSMLAGGAWCPAKTELNMIRNNILRSSDRLRQTISEPAFVEQFGEPHPHPKGERQNVFGSEDELKTAPKGIDKKHKDIDLLKCRSFAVFRTFTDDEVLEETFMQALEKVARILRPFVHCLNDLMTVPPDSEEDSSDGGEED